MANTTKLTSIGNLKPDDLDQSFLDSLALDRQTISGGKGFNGYGWNPLGGIVRIDHDDPSIRYTGDWSVDTLAQRGSGNGREGINRGLSVNNVGQTGGTITVPFTGTAIYANLYMDSVNQKLGWTVSVDGGALVAYTSDNFVSGIGPGIYVPMATGLSYGYHTIQITITTLYASGARFWLYYFDVITTTDSSIKLTRENTIGKSSAFVGGQRVDATTDISQVIDDITNLIPNASFERVSPTWGTVFQDDFNRADGAVGNSWSSGSVSSNKLSLPANSNSSNGDISWSDKQIRFSIIAPSSSFYIYIKTGVSGNYVRATFVTAGSNNVYFEKNINGTFTSSLNPASVTITAGTTYYVTAKCQGNIYSASITTNADFVTGATTTYLYNDEVPTGKIALETGGNAAATLIDNVIVTAPIPDGCVPDIWPTGGWTLSFNNGIYTIKGSNGNGGGGIQINVPASPGPYTFSVKRNRVNGGSQVNIKCLDASSAVLTTTVINGNLVDVGFVESLVSFTAPANTVSIRINLNTISSSTIDWKEPILVSGTYTVGQLQFHTKESRCDLICLQDNGQVMVTKGVGKSELGYRVDQSGAIVNWYRDKKTIQYWDRVKLWKSGSWTVSGDSWSVNGSRVYSNTANDTFYISFVGTGIDLIQPKSTDSGIFGCSIDGGTEFLIDSYQAVGVSGMRIPLARNLSYGQHAIKLRVTATKNTLSSNTWLGVDDFDIYIPVIPVCPNPVTMLPLSAVIKADPDYGWIRYEDNEGILYNGTWGLSSVQNFSAGQENESSTGSTSDYADFTFIGMGIRWVSSKSTNSGIAQVLMDNVSQGNVDCYAATNAWGNQVSYTQTNLTLGFHTIRIKGTGTKNASSTGTGFQVDAFDVKQTLYTIDLRKSIAQVMVEQKIAEHEAKDLWDAHVWAMKGNNPKTRIEVGGSSGTTSGNFVSTSVTFAKGFTVPPAVYLQIKDVGSSANGYITTLLRDTQITTTGFSWDAYSFVAAQSVLVRWIAIGY